MAWAPKNSTELADGVVRWDTFGDGPPIVLVHGTPYSSFLWRDIAVALARHGRQVYVFDHLGYGLSDKREGQVLTLATVTGGEWELGLFALIRQHHEVFAQLPAYAHEALATAHLRNGTKQGYRPGVLGTYLTPWLGADGQAAFYHQYRQLSPEDTADYEHLRGTVDIPVTLLWGRDDQILPAPHGEWIEDRIPNQGLTRIDGAGHLLPEDAPAQLIERLARWSDQFCVAGTSGFAGTSGTVFLLDRTIVAARTRTTDSTPATMNARCTPSPAAFT